jgi:biotin/methionine sulfoxide reductase
LTIDSPGVPGTVIHSSSHWGAVEPVVEAGRLVAVRPFHRDPDPSPIVGSLADAVYHPARIAEPVVRKSWLEHGPERAQPRDGDEAFVRVGWDQALALVAREIDRVAETFGHESIYGGTYGWGSAGRVHTAPTLLRRYLGLHGGYTGSVDSYSCAAAIVVTPHVLGDFYKLTHHMTDWRSIAESSELLVSFGGIALKNAQVVAGGCGEHKSAHWLRRCAERGVKFVNVGPIREDLPDFVAAEWIAPRPGTDVAIMLAIAHVLLRDGLLDSTFLTSHCVGFERFARYLRGETDATPKTPEWAGRISALPGDRIVELAHRMASHRTMLTLSWSLQRADHGEQTYWAGIALAAMLGQIGLPGGGVGFGYAATGNIGQPADARSRRRMSAGPNPIERFIPVARITEMLERPGDVIDYNGQRLTFPDIKLIYWCGGNPFHHHQDLNRLARAWRRPQTVIVHEPWWTPLARRADIVLPATTAFERDDIGGSTRDPYILAMHKAIEPVGQARDDYHIFAELAARQGIADRFTAGRNEMDWIRLFYESDRQAVKLDGSLLPEFDDFWRQGFAEIPVPQTHAVMLQAFRNDPVANPLSTPSGRIELFSERVAGFGYAECPGHAFWQTPEEWLGAEKAKQWPLHLMSNQPKTRLHSQLDLGRVSIESKLDGREPLVLNSSDAAQRGIRPGDIVRVYNDRGACLAGAVLSDDIRPGVVEMATGAWLDLDMTAGLCRHGNVNVLTPDRGTSRLAQGPSVNSCLVEVEKFVGPLPKVMAFDPPELE